MTVSLAAMVMSAAFVGVLFVHALTAPTRGSIGDWSTSIRSAAEDAGWAKRWAGTNLTHVSSAAKDREPVAAN